MRAWVRDKVDKINELYPERRVEESKARWRAIWEGRRPEGRYPYMFNPVSFNYYDKVFDNDEGLRAYLDEFIYRGFLDDDFIPAFFTVCRQSMIPSMFGAKEIIRGNDYTCERILKKPEDIDALPYPAILPGTPASKLLDIQRHYAEECEGEIPVHVGDMQGPMDVAGQLFGYDNLFLCAYDDPVRFRRLLDICSEAFEILWDAQKMLLGNLFIGTHLWGWDWVPENNGYTLSADVLAMISEDFFIEFYRDCLEKIAERGRGVVVHSCGDISAVVKALGETNGVKGVHVSQMSVPRLLDAGWDGRKMIICPESANNAHYIFEIVRERNLSVNYAVCDLWPVDKDGQALHPSAWTPEHRALMKQKAKRVNRFAAAAMDPLR